MKHPCKRIIADQRTGIRPLTTQTILSATFDGDHPDSLLLENGCLISDHGSTNYLSPDGREFAEVLELQPGQDSIDGLLIGFTEIFS